LADTRNFRGITRSSGSGRSLLSGERGRSRLAHWPPPHRTDKARPKVIPTVQDEEPNRARPRGFRISRAIFDEPYD
jgi:hypothetical protein